MIPLANKMIKSDEYVKEKQIMWQEGTIGIPVKKEAEKEYIAVHYTLKVYDEPSKFGINHGKISKLQLKQNGKTFKQVELMTGICKQTLWRYIKSQE